MWIIVEDLDLFTELSDENHVETEKQPHETLVRGSVIPVLLLSVTIVAGKDTRIRDQLRHVKIWNNVINQFRELPQTLPQFDNSMNLAARDKQQGSRLQGNSRNLFIPILNPNKLYPPFQISIRQTPPFSKSSRVIRPPPMTLKGRYIGEPTFSELVEGEYYVREKLNTFIMRTENNLECDLELNKQREPSRPESRSGEIVRS
ncbi:hypothetical protein BYT27DRAFT_7250178 [Phlegmacium glaucopus]|nr:hypothetical protein BYT27DRAFT_7250178 [Phlegmacium glaucopus]